MADVLDQNEIDSLISSLSSGEVDVEKIKEENNENVKSYDFRRPNKLSKEQMRTLEMVHENLARLLTTVFAAQLRTMVKFEVASIEQLSYDEFIKSLSDPTIIGICEMKPLEGQFILEINSNIGFTIIDRLFGGMGTPLNKNRTFTDIERIVLKKVLKWVLSGLPEAWENVIKLQPHLTEVESNPQFTQIVPNNDMTIIITLFAEIAEVEGLINICIPYILLEPIASHLSAQQWFADSRREQTAQHIDALKEKIKKAKLDVYAEIGNTELPVSDLLYLEPGDVVKLDKKTDDKINIRIGKHIKYRGIAGKLKKHMAIKISDVVKDGEEKEGDDDE